MVRLKVPGFIRDQAAFVAFQCLSGAIERRAQQQAEAESEAGFNALVVRLKVSTAMRRGATWPCSGFNALVVRLKVGRGARARHQAGAVSMP